jgi:hypothetical protein
MLSWFACLEILSSSQSESVVYRDSFRRLRYSGRGVLKEESGLWHSRISEAETERPN